MNFVNILVPYDRSESAQNALMAAQEIAQENAASKITVLAVADMPEFESSSFIAAAQMAGVVGGGRADLIAMKKEYLSQCQTNTQESIEGLVKPENKAAVSVVVGQGKPSKAIVEYAEDHQIDLIVMGSRGLNAVRGVLGSVSYAVLRSSECPVMVIK